MQNAQPVIFDEDDDLPFTVPEGDGVCVERNDKHNGFNIILPNAEIFYAENFFNKEHSDYCINRFLKNDTYDWRQKDWASVSDAELEKIKFQNIKWKHDRIKFYGKIVPLPRLTAWYGDPGKSYNYSGIHSQPNEWNEVLRRIKARLEEIAETEFNSVLLNWYRDGSDSLNWHADDESELGQNPVIGSVNFGATRNFHVRRNDGTMKFTVPLKHGTLLIMKGEMQHYWQHAVPKSKRITECRINLTFRTITHPKKTPK